THWVALLTGCQCHALLDVPGRDSAIGAHVIRGGFRHLPEHRTADLHRLLEVFGFDAPGTVVPRAALDGRDLSPRYEFQQLARFLPHVLHTQMTWHVIRHAPQRIAEV